MRMRSQIFRLVLKHPFTAAITIRSKTTSAQYVASRYRDATFEKLMERYKNLLKVISIQDLILANPTKSNTPPSVSLDFLSRLSQTLHLNRGAPSFLRRYPHIFHIFYNPTLSKPFCRLTDTALEISRREAQVISDSLPVVVDRLVRLLALSTTKSLPLRAVFKVWRELGLPDDFEDSLISQNPRLFRLRDAHEPNTHVLELVDEIPDNHFTAAVESWRVTECCRKDCSADRTEIQYSFKHQYPPGMWLSKNFRAKVKEWQRLPYIGPYQKLEETIKSKAGILRFEKRSVAIVHEFLSLTVEKMVEVEKISHFRKCFGIDLNIRDLFLDHPGIFYLSTKGKRHTVFLREAYERDLLIDPNPVYDIRRKLLDLVILGRRGMFIDKSKPGETGKDAEPEFQNEIDE
ncbi:protein ROOT PRIMORDIUM DEFECTIVE 1 isoform X1 [Mercurialis annua]|uniref:protein ROOT PRIMORDIUM DEFECTIVE 1 isoform X1 n=1 Tax=Mercurialis annua TaxID=3986 RepID=UPI00215F07EF|nr:protein ROOT PRIMORDIUM DEFECTIVE 1 isoform X1 [Mercurialis annua]XP_050214685.1 protein ROOT PRIMORDIUM DEFECTIVE 1 isoform X1 [Mercurialis annua]XP_050214686.1 protein ROOT PRIMORDIUM DEFECTIVE 1 isoform X1 [Mercurialis annua]XP_050214687.1 protein ROOT PRIMORDIUM DEFECTIVE 1 isoform X1 [Mercurialis annua]XP_050214689.1 protein ROOT PRIMORDIUM DEFECTIVE 1 isoform X1 [Mercurialis annua]